MLNLSMTSYNIFKNVEPGSIVRASTFVLMFI